LPGGDNLFRHQPAHAAQNAGNPNSQCHESVIERFTVFAKPVTESSFWRSFTLKRRISI
jgi:hypothetical protein